jgi:hypothetical protein
MQDPICKIPTVRRARDLAEVVDHLPGKHKILISNPSTAKKKKKMKKAFTQNSGCRVF